MPYKSTDELKKLLMDDYREIVKNSKETVEIYTFLNQLVNSGSIQERYLFSFVFRAYYNIDMRSITKSFEQQFFNLLQQQLVSESLPNLTSITYELYQIKNKYGNPSMQFPLVTNMVNTINPHFPTFDPEVARLFAFKSTKHLRGFYKKMKRYLEQYKYQHETYRQLLADPEVEPLLTFFDQTFDKAATRQLPAMKKIDICMMTLAEQFK